MPDILPEIKDLGIKLLGLMIITPLGGYLGLFIFERCEKDWKSGNRRKRWEVMCRVFFILAVIGGWLR